MSAHLFSPYRIGDLQLKNRVVMSPMCQYSAAARDGKPTDWHLVHYASRAVGGVGLVIMEMTDVEPDGRISDYDLGIWSDDHTPAFARIVDACHERGAKVGIQIGHAGRKALDAAQPVAPSALAFDAESKTPRALTADEIRQIVDKFQAAARRAVAAGVDLIELHGAHGYLIHQFQSRHSNRRTDDYGEDLARFGCEVVAAVKSELPVGMPLQMRISALEYVAGGYALDHAISLCRRYKDAGVDAFDVSAGGEGPIGAAGRPGSHAGYQVPLARGVRHALGVPVVAVGRLDDPHLAEFVIATGDADLIAVGRGLLRDPYWALHAAIALGHDPAVPDQYTRGFAN